jgi:putative acyl-CoA dehydrogenase
MALVDYNLLETNRPLLAALKFNAPQLETSELNKLGQLLGTAEMQTHARLANVHPPQLHSHDRFGRRIDQVEFHPSYHALMDAAVRAGLHGTPWVEATNQTNTHLCSHVKRAAGFMLFTELEPSILCPISMTYAVMPALRGNAAIAADWSLKLASRTYDSRFLVLAHKQGVTMGMGMTEKQGGSDVRANTTQATFDSDDVWGKRYILVGHKWFFSAPMCDAFLVLAQTASGLSCFFIPRILPDGRTNTIYIQRLKG